MVTRFASAPKKFFRISLFIYLTVGLTLISSTLEVEAAGFFRRLSPRVRRYEMTLVKRFDRLNMARREANAARDLAEFGSLAHLIAPSPWPSLGGELFPTFEGALPRYSYPQISGQQRIKILIGNAGVYKRDDYFRLPKLINSKIDPTLRPNVSFGRPFLGGSYARYIQREAEGNDIIAVISHFSQGGRNTQFAQDFGRAGMGFHTVGPEAWPELRGKGICLIHCNSYHGAPAVLEQTGADWVASSDQILNAHSRSTAATFINPLLTGVTEEGYQTVFRAANPVNAWGF